MLRAAACLFVALAAAASALPRYHVASGGERIVNGTDVPLGRYPSQVSMMNLGWHSCGGSILNENWALTAGHCVEGRVASSLSILAGTVDRFSGGTTHQVSQIILHEAYNPNNQWINDIALLRVASPFVWNYGTQPVALPAQNQESLDGAPATVIGWGSTATGGSSTQLLQEVDIFVVGDDECESIHGGSPHPTNICAGYPGGGKGQCSGDSGGPLFVNSIQVGIVSWSVKPCTVAPYPGVYTEVSAYVDWISANIN